jgi:NAD(P)-dependent dehydrogenase (short-subunit alcohol dehydrogenase family)
MTTVLVIGADTGIAFEICDQLHRRGDRVIAACLAQGGQLISKGIGVVSHLDVTSDTAVRSLVATLKVENARLDWICHVAGVMVIDELGHIDLDEVRRQIEINAIGPLRTVQALLPFLREGSKIGIVTSRVGSLGENMSGGMGYGYRMSKAAANMLGLNLHHDLKKRGIAVVLLHPGMVKTDLTKQFHNVPGLDFLSPGEAAKGLIARMDELTLESSGQFRHANGELLPW